MWFPLLISQVLCAHDPLVQLIGIFGNDFHHSQVPPLRPGLAERRGCDAAAEAMEVTLLSS